MANRTLAALRKFLNWCVGRGIIDKSPAEGIGAPSKERRRDRVLSDDELRNVIRAARQVGHPYGSIVEFLALTGQRREEVAAVTWSEIDLTTRTWTVPATRTKNGKPHLVHLNDAAFKLLEALPKLASRKAEDGQSSDSNEKLIFTTNGKNAFQGFSKAKRALDNLSGISDWTLHDLRRTVVSGMARLGVAPYIADKILNHQSGTISGVAAVYQRHEFLEERKLALNVWGQHLASHILRNSN